MKYTYDEILKYNVLDAIEMKYNEIVNGKNLSTEERREHFKNSPVEVFDNPLLLDYHYVYEHAEELFFEYLSYQRCQGVLQYYTFFKAIIDKYSLEEDYNRYLYGNKDEKRKIKNKWYFFAKSFVRFFGYAFDNRLKLLFEKSDFLNYFLRYSFIYDMEVIREFYCEGLNKLLECNNVSSYYIENCKELLHLIKKNTYNIKIPLSIMTDKNVIRFIARNPNVLDFYCNLDYIQSQISVHFYIEEHKKYCDEQVCLACNGIIPCLLDEYYDSRKVQSYDVFSLKGELINRIIRKHESNPLNREAFYQELSKYMIIGMFISRNYETDPYNVLIDIETIKDFADENNRFLRGYSVYDFLVNYESKNVFEIIEFYNKYKEFPLMEMLYDDWNEQRRLFIEEINSNMLNVDELQPEVNEDGLIYYDITNISDSILVHNTSVPIDNSKKIEEMIEEVKKGKSGIIQHICLSLQDREHQQFYVEKNRNKKTIKFVYGKINPDRVGITYHKDAYSVFANTIHIENFDYQKNRLYTLKSFMDNTVKYNEIVYVIGDEAWLPLGIICEDEISDVELDVARKLNVLIFYRKSIISEERYNGDDSKKKIKSYRHRYVAHGSVFA